MFHNSKGGAPRKELRAEINMTELEDVLDRFEREGFNVREVEYKVKKDANTGSIILEAVA